VVVVVVLWRDGVCVRRISDEHKGTNEGEEGEEGEEVGLTSRGYG